MIVKINAQTNDQKYAHRFYIRTTDESGMPTSEKDLEEIERENANKEVCLNCTKKRCKGSEECFKKERNKRR